MTGHRSFEIQLENFRHEAYVSARFVYADMAIKHAASKSPVLLRRLNDTPMFWLLCGAALEAASYMALGRIFDTKSDYTLESLLDSMEANLCIFQAPALAERKRDGKAEEPEWLTDYLQKAHYPTTRDVASLRKKVEPYRAIYERAIKPARHKYFAHRDKQGHEEVKALFASGSARDLWLLTTFLAQLHDQLCQLLYNGRKPRFHQQRYSIRSIFDNPNGSSRPQERIVREVRSLMEFIESATLNNSFKPKPLCGSA